MGAMIPIPLTSTRYQITTDLIYEDLNHTFEELFGNFLYGPWYKSPLSRLWSKFLLIMTDPRTINLLILIDIVICTYKILCGIHRIYKYIIRMINQPLYENQMKLTRQQQQKSYEEKTSHHAKRN